MVHKVSSKGFSAIETVIVVVIIAIIGLGGWWVWKHDQKPKTTESGNSTANNKRSSGSQAADPYVNWKSATSTMAGFSIKYPTDWTYSSIMGKDNAEHITILSPHIQITMNSYNDASDTKCNDCVQTLNSTQFNAPGFGAINLKQIVYKLDSGAGQALILEQPDSTYYLKSKLHPGVSTTFRAISVLDSEQTYQSESSAQFTANSDYKTAQSILKSISY